MSRISINIEAEHPFEAQTIMKQLLEGSGPMVPATPEPMKTAPATAETEASVENPNKPEATEPEKAPEPEPKAEELEKARPKKRGPGRPKKGEPSPNPPKTDVQAAVQAFLDEHGIPLTRALIFHFDVAGATDAFEKGKGAELIAAAKDGDLIATLKAKVEAEAEAEQKDAA